MVQAASQIWTKKDFATSTGVLSTGVLNSQRPLSPTNLKAVRISSGERNTIHIERRNVEHILQRLGLTCMIVQHDSSLASNFCIHISVCKMTSFIIGSVRTEVWTVIDHVMGSIGVSQPIIAATNSGIASNGKNYLETLMLVVDERRYPFLCLCHYSSYGLCHDSGGKAVDVAGDGEGAGAGCIGAGWDGAGHMQSWSARSLRQ
jgi:hypothetical protein